MGRHERSGAVGRSHGDCSRNQARVCFVLVDKLEQFDTDELAKFGEWAKGEGLQIIGTRVATDDSCTVVIVDGRIEGQDLAEPAPEKSHALDWNGDAAQPTTQAQPKVQQWKGL